MAKYMMKFATLSQVSNVVPFSGLTMREIYSRFVITGQRPIENTNTIQTSEDDPYNSSQDVFDRIAVSSERSQISTVETAPDSPSESAEDSSTE